MKHFIAFFLCVILISNTFSIVSFGEKSEESITTASQDETITDDRDALILEEIHYAAEKQFDKEVVNYKNRSNYQLGRDLRLNSKSITDYYYDTEYDVFAATVSMTHWYVTEFVGEYVKLEKNNYVFVTGSYNSTDNSIIIDMVDLSTSSSYVKGCYDEWMSSSHVGDTSGSSNNITEFNIDSIYDSMTAFDHTVSGIDKYGFYPNLAVFAIILSNNPSVIVVYNDFSEEKYNSFINSDNPYSYYWNNIVSAYKSTNYTVP